MTNEQRFERLERELELARRRSRHWILGLGLGAGLLVLPTISAGLTGAAPGRATAMQNGDKIVRANEFVLEDDQGRVRARLTVSGPTAELILFDENGLLGAALEADQGNSALFLTHPHKAGAIRMQVVGDRASMTLSGGGAEQPSARADLTVASKSAALSLHDDSGRVRAILGRVETTTAEGQPVSYPESSLLLLGPDGKVTWKAP